nr:hypothetical protein [Wadden Sea poxvirus]
MSILNTLRFLECTSFHKSYLMLPKDKINIIHKGYSFTFYKPKESTVRKYLTNAGIYHNDLIILGKIITDNKKLLFCYMDLLYYGISNDGYRYKLGNSIDNISLSKYKQIYNNMETEYNNYKYEDEDEIEDEIEDKDEDDNYNEYQFTDDSE